MSNIQPQRFAIMGTGAIGSYYGFRLLQAGHQVHFVARSDTQVLTEQGLCLDSLGQERQCLTGLNVHDSVSSLPSCDWVLVTTKTTADAEVAKQLAQLAGEQRLVLMQNGLGNEERMRQWLEPRFNLFAGLCFIYAQRLAGGHVQHSGGGSIQLGWHSGVAGQDAGQAAVDSLVELLNAAGVEAHSTSLPEARWQKLLWNTAYNGPSVVLNASTSALMEHSAGLALVQQLMQETQAAAAACGVALSERLIPAMLKHTAQMQDYYPSMYHDYQAGRPMELEAIYRAPLLAAKTAGYDMAATRLLLQQLEFKQRQLALP